jgi:thiol-disulfide isomerase/thioredoxin
LFDALRDRVLEGDGFGHFRYDPIQKTDSRGAADDDGASDRSLPTEEKETPMRTFRNALTTAGLLILAPSLASAQTAPESLLKTVPHQLGVDFDNPTDRAVIDACKVEKVVGPDKRVIGYALRDGQGKLLRRYVDTNGTPTQRKGEEKAVGHLDQWSYYQNGFEVYRESDLDEDGTLAECRWLNAGGTRIGIIKGGKIVGWKRISAEEASKVMVQAIVSQDLGLLESLMAAPEELAAIGAPEALIEQVNTAKAKRAAAFEALTKGLVGWDQKTHWQRFDGTMPHIIPADAGLKDDLVLYENAFIFAGLPNGQGDPMKVAYLQSPEIIKIGDTWKFVELPRAIDPKAPPTTVVDAGFRSILFREGAVGGGSAPNPKLDAALKQLADYDQKTTPEPDAPKAVVAEYLVGRVKLLDLVMKNAGPEEKLNYLKQIVDTLAQAYQTGVYPPAGKALGEYAGQQGKIASYAAFRKMLAEYQLALEEPGANDVAAQMKFMTECDVFLTALGKSDEAAEVLLQLASLHEFDADEAKAKTYYARLAEDFPSAPAGRKAAGAIKRLGLVGKTLELTGDGLDGRPVSIEQYKGKTVLVHFWTSGVDSVRKDLPDIVKVQEKFKAKGFDVIGINLDTDKAELETYLKSNPLPWVQIYEEGGMDSRLADEFGIIAQPTMFLVDGAGKVLSCNIRNAAELERFLEKLSASGATPIARQ